MIAVRVKPKHAPRPWTTYRWGKRKMAIWWDGVTPDAKLEFPPLKKTISKKGEVHHVSTDGNIPRQQKLLRGTCIELHMGIPEGNTDYYNYFRRRRV